MRRVLHILTQTEESLAETIISLQRRDPDLEVRVVDLNAADTDYRALLAEIFASDSTEVW